MSTEMMETTSQNGFQDETAKLRSSGTTERFLTFQSDGLTFGVSTNYIIEIITNHLITMLPMVPGYVKGIMNLRGQIIPVIDIRLRMGKMDIEYSSTSCIIVLSADGINFGIMVDSVEQVLDIDSAQVSPVPSSHSQELVSGMLTIGDGSTILILDCDGLVAV